MPKPSIFAELHKRKVFQVAAIYGAVAWGVTEVLVTVVEQLFLPQWVSTLAVIGFVVGFPVAMFLAWTFDFTADGIRRTEIASSKGKASIALSLLLLIAGTGGLFLLIRPSLSERASTATPPGILPNSVVVLPFDSAGLDLHDAYLGEGLSDELRDELGRVGGIRVAARSSSRTATERQLDAMEVSEKLRVANIVEGSIRRHGGNLRVSVQLIEGSSGLAVWSETFERGPGEMLAVQQAIAEAVVRRILPDSSPPLAEPVTRDATANELMLLARHYEQQVRERPDVDRDLLEKSIGLYRQATEADPDSAIAYSRLAGALLYLGDLQAAEAPIFKALSLAPELSEVQNTLGDYYWVRGLVSETGAAWALAAEANPNNPEALSSLANWRWKHYETDAARQLYRRALELDRLNLERYAELGSFLALQGFYEEARGVVEEVEGLFEGASADVVIGELRSFLGDLDQAIAWTIRARDLEPGNSAHTQRLAEYYADIGDFDTALTLDPDGIGILFKMREYSQMIDLAEIAMIEQPEDLWLKSLLAVAHNAQGAYNAAIHVLSSTGLPESVLNGWRSNEELEAYRALMNAVYGAGETELARDLAQRRFNQGIWNAYYWWANVPAACELAILGRDDEARGFLERSLQDVALVWDPILLDAPCFARFKNDPVYLALIRHYQDHRQALRERLPATLAEFGVEL